MTTTTTAARAEITTTPLDMNIQLLGLITAFGKAETADTKAEILRLRHARLAETSDESFADDDGVMDGLRMLVDQALDGLMAERLAADRRQVPLLGERDVDRVLQRILEAGGETSMDRTLGAAIALLRPMIERVMASRIRELTAIDNDLYTAFNRMVEAIADVASAGHISLYKVVELPVARAQVYRACMSRANWRKLGNANIAVVMGITLSSTFGGLASLVDDEEMLQYEAALNESEAAVSGFVKDVTALFRAYYRNRGREIWPTAPSR